MIKSKPLKQPEAIQQANLERMARSVIDPEDFLSRIEKKMKQAIQDDIDKPNDQLTTLLDEIIMADLLVLYGVTGLASKLHM